MADNSEPLDYEPLTNQRGRLSRFQDEVEAGFGQPSFWGSTETTRKFREAKDQPLKKDSSVAVSRNHLPADSKAVVLRKGHTLSFVGIYLFSVMVYFRPYEWSPSLFWLSSAAFWIAVATLLVFIPTQLGLEGNLTIRTPEVIYILLVLFIALCSIPFALSPSAGFTGFVEYAKVVLMFIVMVNVVRTEKRLRSLLLLAFIASVFVSLGALYDFIMGNLTLQGTRIAGLFGGLFSNPNDLALHLVTMTPIAMALFLGNSNVLKKFLYGLFVVVFIAGIVSTFSRGGFLGLAATLFVFFFRYSTKLRLLLVVGAIALVIGLVAALPADFRSRLMTRDASAISRVDDLKRSVFLAVRHPLLGIGLGNYVFYSNQAKATHNAYTQVASEIGLLGATFYILFLLAPMKPLLAIGRETRGKRKEQKTYYLSFGLQAAMIGYMITSFFASVPYLWYAYYLVAYSVALRRIYYSVSQREVFD